MGTYTKGKATKLSTNFTSTEFDCKGANCCRTTLIEPQLVEYLQKIRDHFGKPIIINSGYRCPQHNRACGGANASRHTIGSAADIVVKGIAPLAVAQYAESIGIKGIGLYDSFTHIDTRNNKSFWYGYNEEYRNTFNGATANKGLTGKEQITIALPVLAVGASGKYVRVAQALLNVYADGILGSGTDKAIKAFQKKKGLPQTGTINKDTWSALLS